MKTTSDVQDTAKNNHDKSGSNAPTATPRGGSWQFYFIVVALGFGLLVLLGKALGLF